MLLSGGMTGRTIQFGHLAASGTADYTRATMDTAVKTSGNGKH